jgi:hypothetical protein
MSNKPADNGQEETPRTDNWGTVADQLDETMRQRLLEFGKSIL